MSLACASLGFRCSAEYTSTAQIERPTAATGIGCFVTNRAQRHQNPVPWSVASITRFGITRTELSFGPSSESSAGTSVIPDTTETAGISIPPIPIERITGIGRITRLKQTDRDGRAGDDHRAARMGHRLDHRGLDVGLAFQLLSKTEDHQQRVVDRDAEPD